MTIAMAGATPERLIFGADTKMLWVGSSGKSETATCSKITVYKLGRGNLVIAHAGEWIALESDDLFHDLLRNWDKSDDPLSRLCAYLDLALCRPNTRSSFNLGRNLVSELLVGVHPRVGSPSMMYVSSGKCEAVPLGMARMIGGVDTGHGVDPHYRPAHGAVIDIEFVVKCIDGYVRGGPREAFGYPIELVGVTGPGRRQVLHEYRDRDGGRCPAPDFDCQIPPPLSKG